MLCGGENDGDFALCRHHTLGDLDWHVVNRIFCDFLHRNIIPPPLVETNPDPVPVLDVAPGDTDTHVLA